MKIFPECVSCVLNQGLRTIKKITDIPEEQWRLLRIVYNGIGSSWHEGMSPIDLSLIVNDIIVKNSNESDPYLTDKDIQNKHALEYYERIKIQVEKADCPLKEGIKYAICGNKIDLGIFADINIRKTMEMCSEILITDEEVVKFKKSIEKENKILYLTDNAGEIVFDKILIDYIGSMGKEVFVGVRKHPIINDVTEREAEILGFSRERIIPVEIGDYSLIGGFPMVVAKGQANFEMYHMMKNVYFLFLIKCNILAKALGMHLYSAFFSKYGEDI